MADVWNGRIFTSTNKTKQKSGESVNARRERERPPGVRGQLKSKRAAAYLTNKARR